jgi:hypothetical protein
MPSKPQASNNPIDRLKKRQRLNLKNERIKYSNLIAIKNSFSSGMGLRMFSRIAICFNLEIDCILGFVFGVRSDGRTSQRIITDHVFGKL